MTTENTVVAVENEEVGKFLSLNYLLDHEKMDFVGYEFRGEEIIIEDSGCEQSLFRMDVDKKTGEITVNCAYSEDFDIMEDCTYQFDTEKLSADIKEYMEKNDDYGNQGDVYVEYVKLTDDGWDCSDAVDMAYEAVERYNQ